MAVSTIAVLGAGNVGGACAASITDKGLGNVLLYDSVEGLAIGKAMDINQASTFFHTDMRVLGCKDISEIEGAEIVVIAAGLPRQIGMDRKDLLSQNLKTFTALGESIMTYCPDAKVLVVSNPVDSLSWFLNNRWSKMNVFGLGCSLDTCRLRFFLAETLHASVDSVNAIVIGLHNRNMMPLVHRAMVGGVPIRELLSENDLSVITDRTRNAGNVIVNHLKTRGSYYAAAQVVAEIVDSIVHHRRSVFPVSVRCNGEYGVHGISLALPCVLGDAGIESIIEMPLDSDEKKALDVCIAKMEESIRDMSVA